MNQHDRPMVRLEHRIRDAENELFAVLDAEVEERFLDLERTDLRVRVLSHGSGVPLLLMHGVSLMAAAWAPLFAELQGFRLLALDLPGHGLSDPVRYRRGRVREHAHRLIDDVLDALGLDDVPVVGHSLGGMFALWHAAAGSERISEVIAVRSAGGRASGSPRADAAVAVDGAGPRRGCPAFAEPTPHVSTPARPGSWFRGGEAGTGLADRGAASVRAPARERPHRRLADARDRSLPTTEIRERVDRRRARGDPGAPRPSSWEQTTPTSLLVTHVPRSPGSRTRRSTKCPQAMAHGSSTLDGSPG